MNNNPLTNSFFVDYGAYVNLFNAQVAAGNSPGNNPVGWQVISDASTAAWQAMGSPNVYDVVGGNIKFVQGTPFDMCFKYLGTSPCAGQQAYLEYITSPSITPAQQGSCQICQTQLTSPVSGCTDSQASNFDPNATQDDGSCDYGWRCQEGKDAGIFGCYQGNATNPGIYATQQACQSANSNIPNSCGGGGTGGQTVNCSKCQNGSAVSNIFQGTSCPQGWQLASLGDPCKSGGGPVPTNPVLQTKIADPQIDRMKNLAFRGKK